MNIAYNMDCLEAMRAMKDNEFDLAVVDPPYGDALHDERGVGGGWFQKFKPTDSSQVVQVERERERWNRFGGRFNKYKSEVEDTLHFRDTQEQSELRSETTGGTGKAKKIIAWDIAPGAEYFEQLFRVSRNQIIWGGNYFDLPPTRCFLIWRKTNVPEDFSMAMAEYAWTSFTGNAKVFDYSAVGQEGRFHPTQKPPALYAWIYRNYANEGDKILDTHLGSGSSRIAAYDLGFDFVGYEIDKEYFDKQEARFERYTAQQNLFLME